MRTPKLRQSRGRPSPGKRYYAGYDPGFVEDMLRELHLGGGSLLLDPWNGAGTTTEVAARLGQASMGFDINPAMVMVAKSKLLSPHDRQSLPPFTEDVLRNAKKDRHSIDVGEPLLLWFHLDTAKQLRRIQRAIESKFVPTKQVVRTTAQWLDDVSALAAAFYVVLFETVRGFLHSFTGANPTWFKGRVRAGQSIKIDPGEVDRVFRLTERRLHGPLALALDTHDETAATLTELKLGASSALPTKGNSFDGCITSPPYCTRIEYPVLTRPELAVLGIGEGPELRQLREASIGTTTMTARRPTARAEWGPTINAFLEKVAGHSSKASSTYYHRYFLQYFAGMDESMAELKRVLKPGAKCAVVVQDSYYKDVHNDLATGLMELAESRGMNALERYNFDVQRTMAQVHPGARRYRKSFKATESLIVLKA